VLRTRRASFLLVVLALLLPATACSGDGSSTGGGATPDPARVRAGLTALYAGDHASAADRADGACFARELTSRTTPERLREAGVLDASYDVVDELPVLPRDTAESWAAAQLACADFVEAAARAQERISHGAVDPGRYAACLRHALDDEALRAALVATLTGDLDGPAVRRLTLAQARCARD
jgi:hypothetical protein